MNYLQALGKALERGADPGIFSPELVVKIAQIRTEIGNGQTLVIEPYDQVSEKIIEQPNGRKAIRYFGRLVHGFKSSDGQMHLAPDDHRPVTRDEAVELGVIAFLIDANGKIVGWYDQLTGETYGEKVPKKSPGEKSDFILALPWIVVCAALLGGVWFLLRS